MGSIDFPDRGCTAHTPRGADSADFAALLAHLPTGPQQAATALDAFLDRLLQAPPPAPAGLQLLEQARRPLGQAAEGLTRIYADKLLPLGNVEEAALQQTLGLWQKTARAYARCAQFDSGEGSEQESRTALVLHRCLHATGMLIAAHQRARRELPPGVWLDLHGYYASAEEWGVATRPLHDPFAAHGRQTHCSAAYTTTLLADLAGPYGLSVCDQELVQRWAAQWAPLVGIAAAQPGEALPAFVVDLMQDAGVKPTADCLRTENIRRLDTSRLAMLLTQAVQQLAQHLPPEQVGLGDGCTASQCKRLLEHLTRPWSQARAARKFRRHAATGLARVAGGFETMHYLVSGREFSQPDVAATYSRQDFDALFVFRHMADPTAQLHIRREQQATHADEWEVVNQSANGFRLMRSLAGNKVTHGQLLAVRPADGDRYFFAQVCWLMQDRSGGLVTGIASLPGMPQAIAARLVGYGQDPLYRPAFLLPAVAAIGAGESLVLPAGWFQADRLIELHVDCPRQVRLDRVLQEGPEFARVSFRPAV